MTLLIDDPEFDRALMELVAATGEPEEVSVRLAVKERLDRVSRRKGEELLEKIRLITSQIADTPTLDARTSDEIIGYNEHGLFD